VILKNGVEVVSRDPSKLFPPPLWESLKGKSVLDKDGKEISIDSIREANDVIGFYFSAHWCGPCKAFTPELAKSYNALRAGGKKFEIVFCTSDKDDGSFKNYFATMPWKALPYKEKDGVVADLNARYSVEGIPTLVLVDKKGSKISDNGRALVTEELDSYPWTGPPKPLLRISGVTADHLNNAPVFLAIVDAKGEEDAQKILEPVAAAYVAKWEGKDSPPLRFLYGGKHPIVDKVKGFLGVKSLPFLAIVNLPEGEKYLPPMHTLSADNVKSIVDKYLAGGAGLTKTAPRE